MYKFYIKLEAINLEMNLNNINTSLVFCGLENLTNLSKLEKRIVFGEWMSEITQKDTNNVLLFPFNFNLKEIQTKEDIVAQDEKVRKIYDEILPQIGSILNKMHKENFSTEQWEIIIGYWLRHFLDALMVRWVLVSAALDLDVKKIYLLDSSKNDLCPQPKTRDDFAILCNSSKAWNQFIISKIAREKINANEASIRATVEIVDRIKTNTIKTNAKIKFLSIFRVWFKNLIKIVIETISRIFPAKILIYSPTLSILEKVSLSIKLKKFPFIYFLRSSSLINKGSYDNGPILNNYNNEAIDYQKEENDSALRNNFSEIMDYEDRFASIVIETIAHNIPRCYVEEWNDLKEGLDKINLPKTVDQIYVGSGIITDEILRLHVARMYEENCEFIISQHGGVYGFSLIQEKTEFVEQRTANKWISWGWESKKIKTVIPGPALKGRNDFRINKKGDSLIVALPPIRFSPSRLNYSDPYEIVKTHIDFIHSLSSSIQEKTIIRPAPNHRAFNYVKEFEKDFTVSKKGTFWDDLSKSKLFLCTHNSTTMLESLYANFPTIILLPKYKYYTQHYLREEALPIIQEMKRVGIYYDDPEKAMEKINSIWGDINLWWESDEVQQTVNKFCQTYCMRSNNNLDLLSKIISEK